MTEASARAAIAPGGVLYDRGIRSMSKVVQLGVEQYLRNEGITA